MYAYRTTERSDCTGPCRYGVITPDEQTLLLRPLEEEAARMLVAWLNRMLPDDTDEITD